MLWAIFLFQVGTHVALPNQWTHRYPSQEICEMEAHALTNPGVSYAICRPVSE